MFQEHLGVAGAEKHQPNFFYAFVEIQKLLDGFR